MSNSLTDQFRNKIKQAEAIVSDLQDEKLKKIAFNAILQKLIKLEEDVSPSTAAKKGSSTTEPFNLSATKPGILKKLSMTDEQINNIYAVKNNEISLKVEINGDGVPDVQRKFVRVLLFGYKILLDTSEVESPKLLKVAKDWDITTGDFVRNIGRDQHIQIRNKGKGKNPIYSLKPGAIKSISKEVKKLLNERE